MNTHFVLAACSFQESLSSIVHYNNISHLPLHLVQEVLSAFDIATETIICLRKASISQNNLSSGTSSFLIFFGSELYGKLMMMNYFMVWLTDERRLALFPAYNIAIDPHHLESLTSCKQDWNLRRI